MTWYKPRQRELSSARYFFFFSWDKIWWSGWTLTSQSSSSPRSSGTPCWGWSCSSCTSTSPAWTSLMSSLLSFCQHLVEVCQRWWCSGWTFSSPPSTLSMSTTRSSWPPGRQACRRRWRQGCRQQRDRTLREDKSRSSRGSPHSSMWLRTQTYWGEMLKTFIGALLLIL